MDGWHQAKGANSHTPNDEDQEFLENHDAPAELVRAQAGEHFDRFLFRRKI